MSHIFPRFINNARNVLEFYVDPQGSDVAEPGRGSILQPFATIPAALAAIVTAGAGQYVLNAASGIYSGAPIAWPNNVSLVGADATDVTINHVLSYTAIAAASERVEFTNLTISSAFTFNLSASAQSLIFINNCGLNVARTDTAGGPHAILVENSTINGLDVTGVVQLSNCLFIGGTYTVNASGLLGLISCTANQPITVNGTLGLSGCNCAGNTLTGSGTVNSDSSSLFGVTITGPTLSLIDDAQYVSYDPAVPGDWSVPPTQVAQALDELAAGGITPGTGMEENAFVFQPGGIPSGNTYDDFTVLYNVTNPTTPKAGPITIYFDNTDAGGADVTIPPDTYQFQSAIFDAALPFGGSNGPKVNILIDGVVFDNQQLGPGNGVTQFRNVNLIQPDDINGGILFNTGSNGTPLIFENTIYSFTEVTPPISFTSFIEISTPDPITIELTKGSQLNGDLSSTLQFPILVGSGSTLNLILRDSSTINANAIGSSFPDAVVNIIYGDDSTGIAPAQLNFAGTINIIRDTDAFKTGYVPTVPGDWAVPPIDVGQALDELADAIPIWNYQFVTLSGTDITNQYVDLAFTVIPNSLMVTFEGVVQSQGGANNDYNLSTVGGVTRVQFANDLATGGSTPLVAGDALEFRYTY